MFRINLIPHHISPGIPPIELLQRRIVAETMPVPWGATEERECAWVTAVLARPVWFHRLERYPRQIGLPLSGAGAVVIIGGIAANSVLVVALGGGLAALGLARLAGALAFVQLSLIPRAALVVLSSLGLRLWWAARRWIRGQG